MAFVSDEQGFEGHPCTEVGPLGPVAIGGGGLARKQPLSDVFCRSAEAIPEASFGGGIHSRHGSGWGEFVSR